MATVTYTSRKDWKEAVKRRGLFTETEHGDEPSPDDVFRPTYAVNRDGDIFGMWCLSEEGWTGCLSGDPMEFHQYINAEE